MASITVEGKSYMVYAVISKIADNDITSESVKFEFPIRNSRAAQKAIAENKKVKAKVIRGMASKYMYAISYEIWRSLLENWS